MRGSEAGDQGEVGENAATLAFSKIGWHAVKASRQELGTDLLVDPRDRRFSLRVFIGAQIKSGPSWFRSVERSEDGETAGWWFWANREHVDYWLGNNLPHLIVLHDPQSGVCYWQHLTNTTVERTSKGGKVLVPVDQTIVPSSLKALLAVAATARADVPLEGTAWTGAVPVMQADHLRFALIVPRVIAPHPNRGGGPKSAVEAIGLIAQARSDHVWRPLEPFEGVPTKRVSSSHRDWLWRFAAALDDWMSTENAAAVGTRVLDAGSAAERVAATVVAAHAHLATAMPADALELVDAEVSRDEAAPVDFAWLQLQKARALFELGDIGGARAAAELALPIGQNAPDDLTASAISGTAMSILFNADPWERDVGDLIASNDTAVRWWRSQSALTGAVALSEVHFRRAMRSGDSEYDSVEANNSLFAAASQAGFLGSHGQWRHYTGLLARQQLASVEDQSVDSVTQGLELLRLAGDTKAIERAARWFVVNGPVVAVADCARAVDLVESTSSTFLADVALLGVAADALDEGHAEAAVRWLLDAPDDPSRVDALTPSTAFNTLAQVGSWLTGPVSTLGTRGAELVVEGVERYGDAISGLADITWDGLICSIPTQLWTSDLADRLVAAVPGEWDRLRLGIGAVAAQFDPGALRALVADVRDGNLSAICYITGLKGLNSGDISALQQALSERVSSDRSAAKIGQLSTWVGFAPLYQLTRVVIADDESEYWHCVIDALTDSHLPGSYKQQALEMLAFRRHQLGAEQVSQLARAIGHIEGVPRDAPWRRVDISSELRFLELVLRADAEASALQVGEWAATRRANERAWAAALAETVEDIGALVVLAGDDNPGVRATAAGSLTRIVAAGNTSATAWAAVRRAARDQGRETPIAIARELATARGTAWAGVRATLTQHPCAEVRRLATIVGPGSEASVTSVEP